MRRLLLASVALVSTLGVFAACVGSDPTPATGVTPDAATPDSATSTPPPPVTDSGTPSSDSGPADAGPKTFCQQATPAAGVTDYICVDFDGDADPADGGYTTTYAGAMDAGTLTVESTAAFSTPNGLAADSFTTPHDTASRGEAYEWKITGGNNIKKVVVHAQMRLIEDRGGPFPSPGGGSAVYMKVHTSSGSTLSWGYGDGVSVSGNPSQKGLFMDLVYVGGAAFAVSYPIPGDLEVGTWTDVAFEVDPGTNGSGTVNIAFNGTVVTAEQFEVDPGSDVTIDIGNLAAGEIDPFVGVYYDNIELSVTRDSH